MVAKFIHFIQEVIFDFRVKRAIKQAQKKADLHRRKFLVLMYGGRPVVISMQAIKRLIRQRKFTKDFTAETARKLAIFEATPKPR